jgi:esterase/lipase
MSCPELFCPNHSTVVNRSFVWTEGDHAVLLIHGFPGTPAEMLPLGTVLREAGWTVHGMIYRDKFSTKLELITFMERKVKGLSGMAFGS